jgi:multidrug efflux pump subunit AcrA (membrane-fusion protein)
MNEPVGHGGTVSGDEMLSRIDRLLDDLARLAQDNVSFHDFFRQLLDQAILVTDAHAAAVWSRASDHEMRLVAHSHLERVLGERPDQSLAAERRRLLSSPSDPASRCSLRRSSVAVPTLALTARILARGSPEYWLTLYVDEQLPEGLHPGYLSFVEALAEVAEEYLLQHRRSKEAHQDDRQLPLQQFAFAIHEKLALDDVAHDLANETRRILDCDRVTVAAVRGKKCRVLAVSGVAVVSRRSRLMQRQLRLMECVTRSQEILIHDGRNPFPPRDIEQVLQRYLDEAASKHLVAIPLSTHLSAGDQQRTTWGVLLIEHFQQTPGEDWFGLLPIISHHAALAMERAVRLSGIPLLRMLLWMEPVFRVATTSSLWRWGITTVSIAAILAALVLIKTDFDIRVRGQLVPAKRVHVFAPLDGVVEDLVVDYGQHVEQGDRLARVRSNELELELRRATGELATARQQLDAIQAERLQFTTANATQRIQAGQLTAQELIVRGQIENLERQCSILTRQQDESEVHSPLAGTILTWDARERIVGRPVRRGQSLLVIADLSGPWMLELKVPDRRAGHVLRALSDSPEDTEAISFVLETQPRHRYAGKIERVAVASDVDTSGQTNLQIEVAVDARHIDQPRSGAAVSAKIHCGRRSVLFVWLHAVVEELQRRFF